jgi:hypothetical protein
LHLVGYLYYWQMGFNSVFKWLRNSSFAEVKFVKLTANSWFRLTFHNLSFLNNLIQRGFNLWSDAGFTF